MSDEHPFQRATAGAPRRISETNEARYEEGRVLYALKTMHAPRWVVRTLRDDARLATENWLTFRSFNSRFHSFPALLGATTLPGTRLHTHPAATLPALFNAFARSPIMEAFESFYEHAVPTADDRAVGLVFRRNGVRHGLVILDDRLESFWFHGTVMVHMGGTREAPRRLHVCLFQQFLECIYAGGHGWRAWT